MKNPTGKGIKDLSGAEALTDEELVRLIVSTKDAVYYGMLYDRYANHVYNRCLRFIPQKEEAQDLTHDLFIKMYYKLSSFEHRSSFSTWLYTFTYNFCLNHLNRKYNGKKEKEQAWDDQLDNEAFEISDSDIMALKSEKLAKAMDCIDTADKLILLMKYQDEFTIKEISESLNIGESAVKMRINRAKKRVLDEYEKLES